MRKPAYLKIVDAKGAPIPARAYAGHYDGAAYGRRMNSWGTSTAGANTTLFNSLNTLRARARQLVRNDPLATGGMGTLVANLVGTGITPRWRLKNPEIKAAIQELWSDWTEEADADGICDFYGLQSLLTRGVIEGGHMLVRFRSRGPEAGLSVPLQLQLIEGDHLDETYNTIAPNGNEIRMGIELDKTGQRAAYWLFKEHPGESFITSKDCAQRIRVPASEIIHVFQPLRAGQMIGVPWLASVIVTQHETNQFDDAEIVRKKGAAMFGGFIVDSQTDYPDVPGFGRKVDDDLEGQDVVALEPGTFPVLPDGKDVRFSTPADVGGGYEAFTKRQDRRSARGFGGLTYEKFTGDLEGVTYSSIRAGNLEFQRLCKQTINNVLVFQFCRQVVRRWLDTAVLSRALDLPDYLTDRRQYYRLKWDHDGWPWVDPEKDGKAAKAANRNGFKSRSQIVGEMGHDSEMVDEEIARDNARADQYENVYDSDGRMTDAGGKIQQTVERDT